MSNITSINHTYGYTMADCFMKLLRPTFFKFSHTLYHLHTSPTQHQISTKKTTPMAEYHLPHIVKI
ncbi:Arginine--tRNA ligase [Gossypium arboreum]|uniref:Arginine--tRNA ligase n=1 Tax=Gossypium arboreum TaxID=29729 RepID=A0A0B0PT00_GOSAR|nr:Arginine--tRNA ligase [Gossypium arboreum]